MIEEKLKIAAEKLPVPKSNFKSVIDRVTQKSKDECTRESSQIVPIETVSLRELCQRMWNKKADPE